ncbi:DinB family protein [Thermomicrobium sp. 4228-Ro]|uniref:DinB family protein n=1 Tax=Thermomicrobium sp. 4228-Ro TaxID=2993937 RepID=UPI00224882FE|nr:DinB family protein [Thermomicrobium sp. 4228-Ro]MCX2728153.1 DinB family protein [Thermomicrobium sp. 4228-Ro]
MSADFLTAVRAAVESTLREQHDVLRDLVRGLAPAVLNWSPGPEMNSIAVLVGHLLDSERYLVAASLGETVERDRERWFRYEAPSDTALLDLIDQVERETLERLERLTDETLVQEFSPPNDRLGRRFTGIRWLLHAIQHNREHIGQALLTRQLAELRGIG